MLSRSNCKEKGDNYLAISFFYDNSLMTDVEPSEIPSLRETSKLYYQNLT